MSLPRDFTFSQASLQDFADCRRRFQLNYVLGVRWPAGRSESSARWEVLARKGAAFHRLVHQHVQGLSPEVLSGFAARAGLSRWWKAYLTAPPAGLPSAPCRSEVRLSAPLGGHRLAARYDLLVMDPGQRAVIVDWKTNRSRPERAWLANRWQTLVYLYVLVEAGTALNGGNPLVPEQVELVYWFANYPAQAERFPYSREQHESAGEKLAEAVAEVSRLGNDTWPLTTSLQSCQYCAYQTLCGRQAANDLDPDLSIEPEGEPDSLDIDLEQIAEIEF